MNTETDYDPTRHALVVSIHTKQATRHLIQELSEALDACPGESESYVQLYGETKQRRVRLRRHVDPFAVLEHIGHSWNGLAMIVVSAPRCKECGEPGVWEETETVEILSCLKCGELWSIVRDSD